MKKLILFTIAAVFLTGTTGTAFAAGYPWPVWPIFGVEKYGWHLSGAVMPVPPYGSIDIPGSDTASKLFVNQLNWKLDASIAGFMGGLKPNTTYTVYISNPYEPYVFTGWNIVGSWVLRFNLGGNYDHDIIIDSQDGGAFTGHGGYPAGGSYSITETVTGTIDPIAGTVSFHSVYNTGYWYDATGTIAPDGTMSGTWGNDGQGYGHAWSSISGNAVKTNTGDTGWTGLFNPAIQPFTFTTGEKGFGFWHLKIKKEDITGNKFSVWINDGLTLLISDNATLKTERPIPPKPPKWPRWPWLWPRR